MSEDYTKLTIRIPSDLAEKIETLAKAGKFKNKSDLVTMALEEFFAKHKDLFDKIKRGETVDLEMLTEDETTVYMDEAIKKAVSDFIKNHSE